MPKGQNSGGPKHINAGTMRPGEQRTVEFAAMGGKVGGATITEATQAASRDNGKKGGPKPKPLEEIDCTCAKGDALPEMHDARCKRGAAWRRRNLK